MHLFANLGLSGGEKRPSRPPPPTFKQPSKEYLERLKQKSEGRGSAGEVETTTPRGSTGEAEATTPRFNGLNPFTQQKLRPPAGKPPSSEYVDRLSRQKNSSSQLVDESLNPIHLLKSVGGKAVHLLDDAGQLAGDTLRTVSGRSSSSKRAAATGSNHLTVSSAAESMPLPEEIDRRIEALLLEEGTKPEVRMAIMMLPLDQKWMMLQGRAAQKSSEKDEDPDDWVRRLHTSSSRKLHIIIEPTGRLAPSLLLATASLLLSAE